MGQWDDNDGSSDDIELDDLPDWITHGKSPVQYGNINSSQPEEEPKWLSEWTSPSKGVVDVVTPSSSDVSEKKNEPKEAVKDDTKTKSEATSKSSLPKSKIAASHLPLILPDKVVRTKVLVECPGDNEATDLDGDIGSVGRFNIIGGHMQLDLKGVIYNATIVPSYTFCVVNVGPTEAKIEAIMNDFVQLEARPQEEAENGEVNGFDEKWGSDSDAEEDARAGRKRKGPKKGAKTIVEEEIAEGADAVLGSRTNVVVKKSKPRGPSKARAGVRGGGGGKGKQLGVAKVGIKKQKAPAKK
mmetsp:Transcript_15596/g.21556  ORF Transcript_15596/g.21556 Transcript_15596/m.21556 type:complete len:299 (+) Transcript_15596:23-919(+)|eukprot:CAMPEP_0196588570 /NCGR_PEP_ID=MMETSP1081-20130531/60945_1 /TAXON_ID=36882 /ORGANISM="Pyramimonas amylifera, Strain CCMP720" /LENGTH=298 /DNA_ID=CAMNT_0041911099 /DNA_START=15 /DNA_END=911 /DNA_ORIENTATION=+